MDNKNEIKLSRCLYLSENDVVGRNSIYLIGYYRINGVKDALINQLTDEKNAG